jgi:glycosyltransferase involved in cell wall biosynthesis
MDAHELFPEVPEIQDKPLVKWVWRTIERWLMPKCDALLTVSQGIADYYKDRYGVEMTVVRNLSSYELGVRSYELRDEGYGLGEKVLLYAGKVNVGRGVDWAIDALEWLPGCRLVVAGDGDLLEAMKAYAAEKAWADRVVFTGRLMPEEMTALEAKADVGLVMLEDKGLSYHYALPNRVGAFVQAGVPMVVSDLPEMARVVRTYGVGEVIDELGVKSYELGVKSYELRVKALAEAVERVLAREWKDEDFAAAREDMDWNKEKQKLINIAVSCKV